MPIKQTKIDQWSASNTPKVWRSDKMVSNPREENKDEGNKNFGKGIPDHSDKLREQKAKIILSKEHAVRKVDNNIYLVRSQTGIGWYKIQWNGKEWICNCTDYTKNGHITPCKHLIALKIRYEPGFYNIEEEILKVEHKYYSQKWSLYNMAQMQEFELFDQFLYQLIFNVEETEQKVGPGRPKHSLRDLIFCCVMKTYSQLSSRRSQYLFHEALQRQQISEKIHYNAISRTLLNKDLTPILYELVHSSAQPLASIETDFAVDSSGFRCSTFGNYCEEKHGIKRTRNWLKAHIVTGVNTNIVADVIITDEHSADSPQFRKLVCNIAKYFNINEVSADMAYSSRKNYEIVDKFDGKAYIPFKKNARGTARGSALWNKMFHFVKLHQEEFMEHYHKRSNAESTFGAIKKKFGESVKSKNRVAQENELLCKIIAYNITVLIHEMIQLNGTTKMLSFNGLQKEETLKQSNEYRNGGKIDGI